MLAHEIKNPLAGIKGAAQLLARKTDAGGERFTTLICAEVDRIATLIDQMEHFSRGQPNACSALNPYTPIHQAMEAVRARQVPTVRFIEDFVPSLPRGPGNHDALGRKSSREEKRVSIRVGVGVSRTIKKKKK